MSEMNAQSLFAMPHEIEFFRSCYKEFVARFPRLSSAVDLAFTRKTSTSTPADHLVFCLGWLIANDFLELLLLCENGRGIGALRLLRTIYERAVAADHISAHPEESVDFVEYRWIALDRMDTESFLSKGVYFHNADDRKTIEENAARVKAHFSKQSASRSRLNRWSRVGFRQMAVGSQRFWGYFVPAYLIPTFEVHATVTNIISRTDKQVTDSVALDPGPRRKHAWQAMFWGHRILLESLSLQAAHFQLNHLADALQVCDRDNVEIWKTDRIPGD